MLKKEITPRGKEKYIVLLEIDTNSSEEKWEFKKKYIEEPEKIFQIKEREQEVLNFYENLPIRIKEFEGNYYNVIKSKEKYFERELIQNFFNQDYSKMIDVYFLRGFFLEDLNKTAIEDLYYILEDNENLSLGDKKIIEDIALETLNDNLKRILNGKETEMTDLSINIGVGLSMVARDKLEKYGFRLKTKIYSGISNNLTGELQKIEYVKLRRNFSGD